MRTLRHTVEMYKEISVQIAICNLLPNVNLLLKNSIVEVRRFVAYIYTVYIVDILHLPK